MVEPRLYINDQNQLVKIDDGSEPGLNTYSNLTGIDEFFGGHKAEDGALAEFAQNHELFDARHLPDIVKARRQILTAGESGIPIE